MIEILFSEGGKLQKLEAPVEGCWINMLDPSKSEIQAIAGKMGVEQDFLTAALDEEERPRIESEDGVTLIVVDIPLVEAVPGSDRFAYATMPLGIIVCPTCLITVSLKKTQLIRDFLENRVKTFCTFKKNRFILQLLYRNATYYLQYLRQIDKITNNIENDLHKSMKNKELMLLLSLEKSLVFFSTSLKSNEIVLTKLMKYNFPNISIKKYPEDEDLLEDVIIENKQAIEMANIYSNILNGMMDAFASIISNNLNIVMKLLASVTIVMSIPNIISGFFGMNVPMPLAQFSWAFYGICGGAALVCAIVAIILFKKKMF